MEDVTLSWPGSMTTEQAKKYLLTSGFVAVELFRQQIAQPDSQHQCALSGRHSLYPDCNFCPVCGCAINGGIERPGRGGEPKGKAM
jgi:hypothetical protein